MLLTTYVVVSPLDSGPGTLREAITQANAHPGHDQINFDLDPGQQKIAVAATPLPEITDPVTIDGTSQSGYAGKPLIEIVGSGLSISAGNTTVKALDIRANLDINIINAGHDVIQGCYLGTNLSGDALTDSPGALKAGGVSIAGASDNQIGGTGPDEGNLIGGVTVGVSVSGGPAAPADHNVIQGNRIGTNGSVPLPVLYGVQLTGDTHTLIGGTSAGARNVIPAYPDGAAIQLNHSGGAVIQGNYIGTDASGSRALPSPNYDLNGKGIDISNAVNTTIGGTESGAGNLISGTTLAINATTPTGSGPNLVQGNLVGTDATGTKTIGNSSGLVVQGDATNFTIGGTTAAARNVISGNRVGANVEGATNLLEGNYIGTDVTGGKPLGNITGVAVYQNAVVGGTASGAGNVISGNQIGVEFRTGGRIVGNFIGTNASGTAAVPNTTVGVRGDGMIGGAAPGSRNIVSGNPVGIQSTADNIQGNWIGLGADGNALPNAAGIVASGGFIGGDTPAAGNVISGNSQYGIFVIPGNAAGVQLIANNYIGTDPAGTAARPNTLAGIFLTAGANVGDGPGVPTGGGNVISGNAGYGIRISSGVVANVLGNRVGVGADGRRLGNALDGINIDGGSANIGRIPGAPDHDANVIAANGRDGILLGGAPPARSLIAGNYIGTDAAGAYLGNGRDGVRIQNATGTTIGGTDATSANVIAFNQGNGVTVIGGTENAILGNSIYSNYALGIDLGNDGITPNDAGDADTGPNQLQNYPVIESVSPVPGPNAAVVTISLDSRPNRTYRIEFFTSHAADLGAFVQGRTFAATIDVTTDAAGHASGSALVPLSGGEYVTATATDPANDTSEFSSSASAVSLPAHRVVGRSIFYNHSAFDGNSAANNAADDAAIATDKKALLPGQTATFANYTSFSRGINGLMIDVQNLPASALTGADFLFKVGNDDTPSAWPLSAAAPTITTRRGAGAGGSDRIDITFPDGAILKTWLQVTLKANANTGLASPDVFYFGNAPGEAGNHTTDTFVTAQDELLARANPHNLIDNPAPIDYAYDYNRDMKVDAVDQLIARNNHTNFTNALNLITAPASVAAPSSPSATTAVRSASVSARRNAAKPAATQAALRGAPRMPLINRRP